LQIIVENKMKTTRENKQTNKQRNQTISLGGLWRHFKFTKCLKFKTVVTCWRGLFMFTLKEKFLHSPRIQFTQQNDCGTKTTHSPEYISMLDWSVMMSLGGIQWICILLRPLLSQIVNFICRDLLEITILICMENDLHLQGILNEEFLSWYWLAHVWHFHTSSYSDF